MGKSSDHLLATPPKKSNMQVRIRKNGDMEVSVGDVHEFPARWIGRMIGDKRVRVLIEIEHSGSKDQFELQGFSPQLGADGEQVYEADGETPKANFTAWVAKRVKKSG